MGLPDLDPNRDPAGAKKYIEETLQLFVKREGELNVIYEALCEQIALGIVRCDSIVTYNREAMKNYSFAGEFYVWMQPVIETMRARGVNMMPNDEVPYPRLIGTRFRVSGNKNARMFDVGIQCAPNGTNFDPTTPMTALQIMPQPYPAQCDECMPSQAPAPVPQSARLLPKQAALPGPTREVTTTRGGALVHYSPYESIESLRGGGGLGAAWFAACFSPLGALVCLTLAAIGTYLITTGLKVLTGQARDELNAHLYAKQVEQLAKRETFWKECMKQRMGITPSGQIDPALVAGWQEECQKIALKNYPDVEPPYASGLFSGLTGVLVAGGLVTAGILLIRARRRRHAED